MLFCTVSILHELTSYKELKRNNVSFCILCTPCSSRTDVYAFVGFLDLDTRDVLKDCFDDFLQSLEMSKGTVTVD